MPRFYCPQPLAIGELIDLPEALAHHVRVVRLQPGAPLTLFNGEGGEYDAELVTVERVCRTARVVHEAMQRDFGIASPRLALAALNPHAGEGGALGLQEITVLRPTAEVLRAEGIDITDPLPADTMFHDEARARYDAAICLYHDQALIPVKTLDFWGGVNATLGLPVIRTSPDHGTGFDIAGKGIARPDSLIAAIRLASEMAARRAAG